MQVVIPDTKPQAVFDEGRANTAQAVIEDNLANFRYPFEGLPDARQRRMATNSVELSFLMLGALNNIGRLLLRIEEKLDLNVNRKGVDGDIDGSISQTAEE